MDLRNAIARVAKFAAPSKDESILTGIRLCPSVFPTETEIVFVEGKDGPIPLPAKPGYVMASDGVVGIIVYLDPDVFVPDMVLDALSLKNAVAQLPKKEAIYIEQSGHASVTVSTLLKPNSFNIAGTSGGAFPSPPKFPETLQPFQKWKQVLQVLAAAGNDDKLPDLQDLHLTSHMVEAGDMERIARVPVALPLAAGVLVNRDLFKHWPRKNTFVTFGVDNGVAVVMTGEELRFTPARPDTDAFDLSSRLPADHFGYRATCPRLALMNAIKFGTTSSAVDIVEVLFSKGMVEVAGLNVDGSRTSRDEVVAQGATDPVRVVVRGRKLWSLLHSLDDEEVEVGYTAPNQPLRLEADAGYVSALWPLIPVST